ncbi:acyl-CoA dehydratase activase-related protein [Desulfofalx alkaliphila]|uniref:acyl-CoA dehydratase activase-related protein n=1 Tax=Desulfofalx alkaliphila TaxID=105483 RepID=UPI0004E1060D|nr:acyl-CoA dehydratase activase-related protein [Desulfofalx alkaliphila]
MPIKVGIPRALLYYYYYPMWKEFFETLGCQVVLSDKTTKGILNEGVKSAVDEACLPIKLAFGHLLNLSKKKVDYIFVPRLVSVAHREYICPKFLGFPDMVKQSLVIEPTIIDVTFNLRRGRDEEKRAFRQVAVHFTGNPFKIWQAYRRGKGAQHTFDQLLLEGYLPEEAFDIMYGGKRPKGNRDDKELKVAVIGHPYNIYDPYISMNLINRLGDMGAKVVTADNLSAADIERETRKLPKKIFWTLGRRMIGAGYYYGENKIDGIIHIAAFACGPDSMTGELIERSNRQKRRVPFLNLTLDEHTGEAGVITRIEAFLDMVRWQKAKQAAQTGS